MHQMAFLGGRCGSLSSSNLFLYHILLVAAGFGRYIFYYVEAQNMVMNAPTFNDSAFTCSGYPEVLGFGYCMYPSGTTSYLELLNSNFNKIYNEQSARITYNERVVFYEGNIEASFNSVLIFQINDLAAPNVMGSGLAMVISPYATPPHGSEGDGLGILNYDRSNGSSSQGLDTRTVALEFDTYMSPNIDTTPVPHLGLDTNSLVSAGAGTVPYASNQIMGLWLDYNATLQLMNVWVQPVSDTTGAAPRPQRNPFLSFTDFRLAAYIQARSYIALATSSTSLKGEQNWIYYWSFQTTGLPPPSPSVVGWLQTWFGHMSPAMRKKVIAGVVVGGMALLCCLMACCYVCCCRRRRRKKPASSQQLGPVKKEISILSKVLVLLKLKPPEKPPRKKIRDSLSVATPSGLWDPAKPDSEEKSPLLQGAALGSQKGAVQEKKESGNTETKIALSKEEDGDADDTDKSSVEKDKACGPSKDLHAKLSRREEKPWQGAPDPGNRTVKLKKPTTEGERAVSAPKIPVKAVPLKDTSLLDLEKQQGTANQDAEASPIPDEKMKESWEDDVEVKDIVDDDFQANATGIFETLAPPDASDAQESSPPPPDELLSSIPRKFDTSSFEDSFEANQDVSEQDQLSALNNSLEASENQSLLGAEMAEEIPEIAEEISKRAGPSSRPQRQIDTTFPPESPVSAKEVLELDSSSPGDVSTAPSTFQEEESVVEALRNTSKIPPYADPRLNSKFSERIAFSESHTKQPFARSRIHSPRKDRRISSQQTAESIPSQNLSATNTRRHTPPLPQRISHFKDDPLSFSPSGRGASSSGKDRNDFSLMQQEPSSALKEGAAHSPAQRMPLSQVGREAMYTSLQPSHAPQSKRRAPSAQSLQPASSKDIFGKLPTKRSQRGSQLPSQESAPSSQTPVRSPLATPGPLRIAPRTRNLPPQHVITPKQLTPHEPEVYRSPSLDQASSSSSRKRFRPASTLQPPVSPSAFPQRTHSPKQEFLPGKHFDESSSTSPHPLPQQLLSPQEPIPKSSQSPSPRQASPLPPELWLEPQWPLQHPVLPAELSSRPPLHDHEQAPSRSNSSHQSSLPQRCVSPPVEFENVEASFSQISIPRRSQRNSLRPGSHRSQNISLSLVRLTVSRSPSPSASRSPSPSPPK